MTSGDDIVSPLELTIKRLDTEIAQLPPFSDKAHTLSHHKNVLIEEMRRLREILNQS